MKNVLKALSVLFLVCLPAIAGAYQIRNGLLSPVGGSSNGANVDIPSCNMQPYSKLTKDDILKIYRQGMREYNKGKAFYDSLSPANSTDPRIARLISEADQDYGSLGFIDEFESTIKGYYLAARRNFLYGAFYGDPRCISMLNRCTRAIASTYIAFGDEYYIDAVDYRVITLITDLEGRLKKKLDKLRGATPPYDKGAAAQYGKAVATFVDALADSVGNIYVGDFFRDPEYDLFNLASQRLSTALTDQASLEYLYNMTPDPTCQWSQSTAKFKEIISKASTEAYIQAAALGTRKLSVFNRSAGLLNNLSLLREKAMLAYSNANILGYDNRFVPMADFDGLNGLGNVADLAVKNAAASQSEAEIDTREYDRNVAELDGEKEKLYASYARQLSELTGVPVPATLPDEQFLAAVAIGGTDLLDCSMELDPTAFKTCLQGKAMGALGSKYNQIKEADLKVDLSIQQREHARERLQLEQAKQQIKIQLTAQFLKDQTVILEDYYTGLIEAQKNKRVIEETTTREWDSKKHKWGSKTKTTSTTRTTEFDPTEMFVEKKKTIDLLNLTTQYNLAIQNADDEVVIRNYLMDLDESLIAVDIATQQMNTISREFHDLIDQKNNLILMYLQAEDHYKYVQGQLLTARVLKSSSVLNAAHDLEIAKHWSYLAAKTLEFQFLYPIVDIQVPGDTLDIGDVFKAQKTDTLERFLLNLKGLKSILCSLGNTFKETEITFSIAEHMLGLTRQNLDPDHALTDPQFQALRQQKFQEFVSRHMDSQGFLSFEFSTSVLNSAFYQPDLGFVEWNMKNWFGLDPCEGTEASGFAVNIVGAQDAIPAPKPVISITHGGDSTFLYEDCTVKAYVPVKPRTFIAIPGLTTEKDTTYVTVRNPRIDGEPLDPSRTVWVNDLKGRSISASRWTFKLSYDTRYSKFDYTKLKDIELIMDTIGIQTTCPVQ